MPRPTRTFVPKDADLGKPAVVEGLYRDLEARPLGSAAALEAWLLEWSDLDAWLDEEGSIRYVDMTCQTDDAAREKRYLDFVENVQPLASVCNNRLEKKFLACDHRSALPRERFEVFIRQVENSAAIFREENVPLQTEDEKLRQQYQKVTGGLTVQYEGREQTIQQMGRYLENTDRHTRQDAWQRMADKWAEAREEIEAQFDKMVAVRHKIGVNAG
ncbi:MAG: M3 family oligoendopeptidase, partial [Planctomycetes bacterium]|nr:M3 family oligoendopeptidase [Planctomycetota bacterium]